MDSTDDEMTMSKTAERDRHLHSSSLARQLAVDAERVRIELNRRSSMVPTVYVHFSILK